MACCVASHKHRAPLMLTNDSADRLGQLKFQDNGKPRTLHKSDEAQLNSLKQSVYYCPFTRDIHKD